MYDQPKVYAVKHRDLNIRMKSRSGGVFTAISDFFLGNNGVVYGCVLSENFQAVHVRADEHALRDQMRGSKYVQSELGDTFAHVKNDLQEGRKVLFTGTSCQVAGLKSFLGKDYEQLLCMDIVCHGVPSPKVWSNYLSWQEKKHHSKIQSVDFRNKRDYGWRDHIETLKFTNEKATDCRIFTKLFYEHAILRPCCYQCPYKSILHPGDITIADFWGVEKAAPEFDDNKGVSLVLINNDKGQKMFDKIQSVIWSQQTKLEDSMQPPLKAPFPRPENRDQFWKDFSEKDFGWIAKKYAGYGCINRMRRFLGRVRRKLIRR